MRTATAKLQSVSPYSQSRYIGEKKTRDETHQDFEERSWRKRCHVNQDGNVFIPPMSFKLALSEAAKYKSEQIPGKGKSTYTKHFEAGVLVVDPLVLPIQISDVDSEVLHVPSDGRRGGTTRVEKHFPVIHSWEGEVSYLVFDDLIDEDVFERTLSDAGSFIGIGRFRPRNNGYYGRFEAQSVKWS
jgi:hypothetical protein